MIKKEDIVEIGTFQKTHALKGELNAILEVEEDYVENDFPLIIEVDGIYIPFYAESIRTKGATSYLIKLKGIDSQEEARLFVNKDIFGMRKDVAEYFGSENLELADDFIGYEVNDKTLGSIGKVKDIDDSTANVLFIVESPDGNTVYIPAAGDLIVNIDDEQKIIETDLPEGLITLNVKSSL